MRGGAGREGAEICSSAREGMCWGADGRGRGEGRWRKEKEE